jgi:hypothetical protein
MATPRPLPFPQGGGDDEEHLAELEKDSGSLIRWEKGDGTPSGAIGMLGVRTVILCLVLCLGRSANDGELIKVIGRANNRPTARSSPPSQPHTRHGTSPRVRGR